MPATVTVLDSSGAPQTVNTLPALGQALKAASLPVVLPSDQGALTVNSTITAAIPTGANVIGGVTQSGTWNVTVSNASLAATQSGAWNITNLSQFGGAAINLGAGAVGTGTLRVTQASDSPLVAAIGATTDAAVANGAGGTLLGMIRTLKDAATDFTSLSPTKAVLATDKLVDGTTQLTPKFAAIAASASGNNTLVAAVTGKKIRVLAYNIIGNGAVNAKFQTGAGGTDLTGLKYIAAAGGGICAPFNPAGWFETAAGALLNLNLSGAVAVGGELVYIEV
jgi:hypothetical protein